MLKKNQCRLLPFVRQDVFGLDYKNQQILPWSLSKFNVPKEWSKTKGEGVIVAVIDTGCDLDHVDLKDRYVTGRNFINKNKDPYDGNGHGTHVAGTIAATHNTMGVVGVAPSCKIMPIKALGDDGVGGLRGICEGIVWAADNGADIITMSLGTPSGSMILRQCINYASSKGCVIFCAAGNSGKSQELMYPAKYTDTISIGSISRQLKISNFSCSTGSELDFLAPGEGILSCVPDNKYANMTGTSMANPFAAGCGALYLSYSRKVGKSSPQKYDYIEHFAKNSMKPDYLFDTYKSRGIITPEVS